MSMDWFQKSMDTLSLNGKGERTQQAYTRALRMLVEAMGKPPEQITEAELEAYFLRRKSVDRWSPNTLRICYVGIRIYFVNVLGHNWTLLNILRAKNESRLPTVLSREEVRRLLEAVHTAHNRAFLSTVYSCGLRLQEALHLEVSDCGGRWAGYACLPRSLCVQGGDQRAAHRLDRRSGADVSLSQGAQQSRAHHDPADCGVHAPVPATCVANRLRRYAISDFSRPIARCRWRR